MQQLFLAKLHYIFNYVVVNHVVCMVDNWISTHTFLSNMK